MKLSTHSHHIIIDGEMVIFDEIGDKYWILNKEETDTVLDALHVESKPELHMDPIKDLVAAGVLTAGNQGSDIKFAAPDIKGIDFHEWQSSFKIGLVPVRKKILFQSALALISACILLNTIGLHRTFNLLRLIKARNTSKNSLNDKDALEISSGIKISSIYIPLPTSCLQHALGAHLLSCFKGNSVRMKIGVKKYDFLAHAWIENNNTVIGDRPDLPELLHTIFSI
ncbi:lasso peptide biosynthesis B2 protein [Pseudomonas resinovorans]|uniref:Lasso peptide biosynthesis B2 protein n=1 Tax=Metapseudomonas resinovorans TaxID=53412 RepID=A0ABT4Y5U0_METRE|nr:lasso peptide biosynthesis B2 protein [Pseudomonas resinovorans]MDA8484136.1 lasso peptide biosynthesis B2 protein [Pseudomonas resinovorans]